MRRVDLRVRIAVAVLGLLLGVPGCKAQVASSELLNASADGAAGGSVTTSKFIARKDWVVRYSFDCHKHVGIEGFGLDLHNADDDSLSDQHEGWKVDGRSGKGDLRFAVAGEYYFDVVSHCKWTIRIKEDT